MSGFGTELLDVAIGLMFVYIVLSLIASAIAELLETVVRTRAKYLWQGLGELLGDPATRVPALVGRQPAPLPSRKQEDKAKSRKSSVDHVSVATLYEHPVIGGLFYGSYADATRRLVRRRLPSYIPRENFSMAVIDIVSRVHAGNEHLSSIESLRRGIAAMPESAMRRTLESITRLAGDDVALVQRRLEAWYDSAMDTISGWYKRHAQITLLCVGFILAAAANIDTWRIAKDLAANEPKRQALLKSASDFAASHTKENLALTGQDMNAYLDTIKGSPLPSSAEMDRYSVLGWLITAFAVSLGAPFWFDLLNKFMVVRSTVKPKEKSQDEGSEDRPASGAGRAASPPPTVFFQTR